VSIKPSKKKATRALSSRAVGGTERGSKYVVAKVRGRSRDQAAAQSRYNALLKGSHVACLAYKCLPHVHSAYVHPARQRFVESRLSIWGTSWTTIIAALKRGVESKVRLEFARSCLEKQQRYLELKARVCFKRPAVCDRHIPFVATTGALN
jgi:hypothetical protein